MTRLRTAFDAAVAERRCRLVTVLGPPGIGKTRLSREFAASLCDEAEVLQGRCLPYGEGITYWPLREIFAAAHLEDRLATALEASAAEEISWTVRKMLEERARERPHVLFFDDIHWAESTLLDLIEHVNDWTREAPLLIVCLSRPELVDSRPAWIGRAQSETIALEPLSARESAELIDQLLDGAGLEAGARTRIQEVAEGNPLFVEQLLAMISEGGSVERVPDTISALLAARLDALPPEDRDLLERASVIGLEFEWEALGLLMSDRKRPAGARLASLVRKGLISAHELIADTFRFRHLLVRDAAYERLPKETRADLHEAFASWLDGRGQEFEEIIGYHLEQAYRWHTELGPAHERVRAIALRAAKIFDEAGRRAYGRGDLPAGSNLLERSSALYPLDDPRRLRARTVLAKTLLHSGETHRAESILTGALNDARSADDAVAVADATVSLAYLRLLTDPVAGQSHADVLNQTQAAIRVYREQDDRAGLVSRARRHRDRPVLGRGGDASSRGPGTIRRVCASGRRQSAGGREPPVRPHLSALRPGSRRRRGRAGHRDPASRRRQPTARGDGAQGAGEP